MPSPVTISCTECGAKLKLPDSSKLGKKIKCPKCSEVFLASSDDEDELESFEDDFDEDDEEGVRPRGKKGTAVSSGSKKGSPGKGTKKGAKGTSGNSVGLIVGVAAGVVVLLGGLVGVLYASGVFGGSKIDPNQIQISPQPGSGLFSSLLKEQVAVPVPARTPLPEAAKWLPPETELVVHVRVADLLKAPLVADLIKAHQLQDQLDSALERFGLKPAEIESVTLGVGGLDEAARQIPGPQAAMMTTGGLPTALPAVPSLGVIQFTVPVTYDTLMKFADVQPVKKAQHAGKEYLEASDPTTPVKVGAFLATEKIVLIGESSRLKTAMEKGANAKPLPNFGFMDWTDHISLAMAPQKPGSLKQQLSAATQGNPQAAIALVPIADGATGFSFGLTVKGGVEGEIAVGCLDASKTEMISKSLTDLASLGRSQYEQTTDRLPPWAAPLTDQLVNNVKVSGSNRVVTVTTSISDSAKEQLAQLPALMMTQFLMNAMLPRGGGNRPDAPATNDSPGKASSPGADSGGAPPKK
jgi:phage FluMu protein Com